MKQKIKKALFGNKEDFHKVKFGIAKNLYFKLNPLYHSQIFWGINELEIHSYFKNFAKESNYILDIGAAFGYYSLIFRKLNPKGKVYLFEPGIGRFHHVIKENFSKSGFSMDNVELVGKMVGTEEKENFVQIDEYFKDFSDKKILFKIDVDGGELDVLKSGLNTFNTNSCKFIIETHSPQLEVDCIALLESKGFKTKVIKNAWYRAIFPENRPLELNRWFIAYR